MRPEKFYENFVNEMKENKIITGEQMADSKEWVGHTYFDIYKNRRAFTEFVNKNIIDEIIKKSGLNPQHEYFRIDSTGYETYSKEISKEADAVGLSNYFWNLKIAVEHENNVRAWMDEVIKLLHIRCPLKVVIAYNYCDVRDNSENDDRNKLTFVAKYMKKWLDSYSENHEEYLIIIGNAAPKNKNSRFYTKFDYRGYKYTDGQFMRLG